MCTGRSPSLKAGPWLSDLNIAVTGFDTNSDVVGGKASHSGRCLQVKSKVNPPPLATKPSTEGNGAVTDVLPTPARCLGTWGLQYSHNSRNTYGAVPAKSTKRIETLSQHSDSESEEKWRGQGGRESGTNAARRGAQGRCLDTSTRKVPGYVSCRGGGRGRERGRREEIPGYGK